MADDAIGIARGTTPRFRRKQTVLAEQFDLASDRPWPFGIVRLGTVENGDPDHLVGRHWIPTRYGPRRVRHGDWVIRESDGTHFRLPAFVFIEQFEPVA